MSLNSTQSADNPVNKDAPNKTVEIQKNNINNKQRNTPKKSALSGLLACYNSDSENDESDNNILDAKVDNFLQEIDEITPSEKTTKNMTIAWQECFDESTGYPYYWNVETNIVTWEMPAEYKTWLQKSTSPVQKETVEKIVEPIVTQSPVVTNDVIGVENKIEINDNIPVKEIIEPVEPEKIKPISKKKKPEKTRKISSDSEDEKIIMITSFCEETSESESENVEPKNTNTEIVEVKEQSPLMVLGPHIEDIPAEVVEPTVTKEETKKEIIECFKEDVDETVILARLRTQAKVLQELDGELPESVDRLLNSIDKNEMTPSLSLVAGYGDDSENEEEPKSSSLFPIPDKDEPIVTSESTLFPATQLIDVNLFSTPEEEKPSTPTDTVTEPVETKVLKRKKRMGISFDVLPTKSEKKLKVEVAQVEERKGFGFKAESDTNSNDNKSVAINFKKGGIAFIKADVLEPSVPCVKSEDSEDKENLDKIQEIVTEKVQFLCEGKNEVSAVQIISIQLTTLDAAYKAGGLTEKYFYSWLRETDTELGKLEKAAAPNGWLCHWDSCKLYTETIRTLSDTVLGMAGGVSRSNKRYFYRNEQSGETQWNYPEQDIVGGGEAMDICTTPPPEETSPARTPKAPSSPIAKSRSPSPPHVAIIEEIRIEDYQPPLPLGPLILETAPLPPPPPMLTEPQPLPPGVDPIEQIYVPIRAPKRESFGSELDSFYSDIAMIEATTSTVNTAVPEPIIIAPVPVSEINDNITDVTKKKKKSKSKLGQGINMKKKAVSSLVEKWKKVQNDFM